MIIDHIDNAAIYDGVAPRLTAALAYLRDTDFNGMELGRYDIDGDNVYVLIQRNQTRRREDSSLEAHRKYIDIHLILSGVENIGWKNRPTCSQR
ncbi:MAG: YhcH/YjgK/YiaL family protein, partial [Lentisphaeria bacterium]|nr:YhcH/YjgK/YiaL family protein [Lentisphaeria bacterium]